MSGGARRIWLACLIALPAGCASLSESFRSVPGPSAPRPTVTPVGVQQASFSQQPLPPPKPLGNDPFAGLSELTADAVIAQVLARNPTLAQMAAAYEAAAARYPQVTALDDPTFGVSAAPAAFGSNRVHGGYRLEASQKLPFPGKLPLRGANALAEARAAGNDVEDTRLQLTEAAASAFYDYYAVDRALEVNRESLRLLGEFQQTAEAQVKNGKAPQSDYLQAVVELGRQRERRLTLERIREVAIARINVLMHLPPESPLPPPPRDARPPASLPDTAALRQTALARRPDLKALADRVAAEQAAVELARKAFGPDVEVMGAYDAFWQEYPLQTMVGVRVNLPVRVSRRNAAIAEAQARVVQRQAELARLTDQVNFQVQEAAAQVRESEQAVRLYEVEILPAAELNVKSAERAYVAGQVPFVTLIEAQRNVVDLRDRYYEAVAAQGRRRATLERVLGGPLPPGPASTPAPPPEPATVEPAAYHPPPAPANPEPNWRPAR
jgi:outer membrane protein TolC